MSDLLAVSKLVTTKLMELRKWRYIAEGVIPLTDLYDEDGNLASVGLKYKVGKGDSYLDGGEVYRRGCCNRRRGFAVYRCPDRGFGMDLARLYSCGFVGCGVIT